MYFIELGKTSFVHLSSIQCINHLIDKYLTQSLMGHY